ncbi:glycerophosphoryl diester phosphodiesterase [Filimonas lacunae]|uniref:Glycerophosphoryl diester phosphodiesterase n=1 Tax=Filimonas lacunae TaxID=477680 RepID=A0A173MAZ4_9BACT|nr:glycerophosphodiester phosphodiesterase family protein [Filimonas lacunae]BAV04697.1 glycerophosphoryl diester phosphodiesterase [Filimonas lacunae]SIT32359.1 glycerophosphoryl diester phosphodiesterase [Filimonas lacunae]
MKNKLMITGILALSIVSGVQAQGQKRSNKKRMPMNFESNIIVAHRGAWKKNSLPQNSIASLQHAIELQCTGSEFDVHMTADDSLVINHDPEFAGKTIEKSTYAELTATVLSNGEKLPTLREYLLAGKQQKTTRLVLEIKPSVISKERSLQLTDKVMQLVKDLQVSPWIVYISFDYDVVKKVHALNPNAPVQYLEGNKTPAELKADGITGADYHYSVFQKHPEWIKEAKELGIVLNAWTVNDANIMDWLLENKFDFITTNEPELLAERIAVKK